MSIPKDWPKDKPLPNPYANFPFIVVDMLTPREVEQLSKRRKRRAPTEPGGEEGPAALLAVDMSVGKG